MQKLRCFCLSLQNKLVIFGGEFTSLNETPLWFFDLSKFFLLSDSEGTLMSYIKFVSLKWVALMVTEHFSREPTDTCTWSRPSAKQKVYSRNHFESIPHPYKFSHEKCGTGSDPAILKGGHKPKIKKRGAQVKKKLLHKITDFKSFWTFPKELRGGHGAPWSLH